MTDQSQRQTTPQPFVIWDPCVICAGSGSTDDIGCTHCRGTGVHRFLHGTKARLQIGDLIQPRQVPNFGDRDRVQPYVYFTGTLDAAVWGAELAQGEGRGSVYVVEPTGEIADDPNLTNKKFPGNPTKSYRSMEPLTVVGEVAEWEGHAPDVLAAMMDRVEQSRQRGVNPIDETGAAK